jgi:hypothetical protein
MAHRKVSGHVHVILIIKRILLVLTVERIGDICCVFITLTVIVTIILMMDPIGRLFVVIAIAKGI